MYKDYYKGWYAVSDEAFVRPNMVEEIKDPKTGQSIKISKETGNKVEWTMEEGYKFRLSRFKDSLIDWVSQKDRGIHQSPFYISSDCT